MMRILRPIAHLILSEFDGRVRPAPREKNAGRTTNQRYLVLLVFLTILVLWLAALTGFFAGATLVAAGLGGAVAAKTGEATRPIIAAEIRMRFTSTLLWGGMPRPAIRRAQLSGAWSAD